MTKVYKVTHDYGVCRYKVHFGHLIEIEGTKLVIYKECDSWCAARDITLWKASKEEASKVFLDRVQAEYDRNMAALREALENVPEETNLRS